MAHLSAGPTTNADKDGSATPARKFKNARQAIIEADHCRDEGDWGGAAECYRLALDIDPSRKDIWVQYGHALKEAVRLQDAEFAYSYAVNLDGSYGDAKLHLAHLLKNTGATLHSIEMFQDLEKNHDFDVKSELDYLKGLLDLDDETELIIFQAISSYQDLPDVDTDSEFVEIGDAFRSEKNWQGAAAGYASALLKNPAMAHIWVQFGHALKEGGATDRAVIAYRKATQIDGRDADAQLHLAHAYKMCGRLDEALHVFDIVRNTGKFDVDDEIKALVARKTGAGQKGAGGKPAGEGKDRGRAKIVAPDAPPISEVVAAADVYRDKGLWQQAAAAYRAVLDRDQTLRHIWVQYGHMLKEDGDLGEAELAYRKAVALDEADPDPLLHLAHLLKRMHRFDDALAVFEKLVVLPGQMYIQDDIVALKIEAEEDSYYDSENQYLHTKGGKPGDGVATGVQKKAKTRRFSVCLKGEALFDIDIDAKDKGEIGLQDDRLSSVVLLCRMGRLSVEDDVSILGINGKEYSKSESDINVKKNNILYIGRSIETFDYRIEEMAFTTGVEMRIRIGGSAASGRRCAVNFYQLGAGGEPIEIMSAEIDGDGPHFMDVRLLSPWMPVLAVFGSEGAAVDVAVLPFPSLLRGGAHFGEVLAARMIAPGMAAPDALPLALLTEFLGTPGGKPGFSVRRLLVDVADANGEEAIFSEPVKQWLATLFGVSVQPRVDDSVGDSVGGQFLMESLATTVPPEVTEWVGQRAKQGSVDLVIPGNALPTLSALVSRRFVLPPGQKQLTGAFIQADVAGWRPRLLVSIPPCDSDVVALQPAGRSDGMPVVVGKATGAHRETGASQSGWQMPLAVCYSDKKAPRDAALLMPRAPDVGGAVLRRSLPDGWRAKGLLSVVVCDADGATSDTLADVLAEQTIAEFIDIIRVERTAESDALSQRLASKFKGRYRKVAAQGASLAEAVDRGLAEANGRLVAVISPKVTLHDMRCLEVLCTMAACERIATASCVQLHEVQVKRGQQFVPATGGYFPTQISLMIPPGLVFREARTDSAFPLATYPVAANAFRLVVMRRDVLAELGGLNAADFPVSRFDLDFCLRGLNAGYLNLCTSAVTATIDDVIDNGEIVDVLSPAALSIERWQDVLSNVSMMRGL